MDTYTKYFKLPVLSLFLIIELRYTEYRYQFKKKLKN